MSAAGALIIHLLSDRDAQRHLAGSDNGAGLKDSRGGPAYVRTQGTTVLLHGRQDDIQVPQPFRLYRFA